MIEYLFEALLITSAAGAVLTLLLALTRSGLRRCFSANWHYYIWLVPLLVMILPVRLDFAPPAPLASEKSAVSPAPAMDVAVAYEAADTVLIADDIAAEEAVYDAGYSLYGFVPYIWLLVMLVLMAIRIGGYSVFLCRIRRNSYEAVCHELSAYTSKAVRVRKCTGISSPCMTGIFRPILLLPDTGLTDEQMHNILLHEMTHLKRKDILYKWLVIFVKCVHWFNPAVYYISARVGEECEISCDLSVVKNMTNEQERSYVNTIIDLLSVSCGRVNYMSTGMTGSKGALKKRFILIKNKKSVSKRAVTVSVTLSVLLVIAAVFAGGCLNGKIITSLPDVITDERLGNNFNFLIVGTDEQGRADTVMLAMFGGGNTRFVSIPRDTAFDTDSAEMKKISAVIADGDAAVVDAVRGALSVPVEYYARVDISAIEELVDIYGGLDVNVPMDMEYDDDASDLHIKLKAGVHTLSGEAVCGLLRFRRSNNGVGYTDGDMSRIRTGHQVLSAFINRMLTGGTDKLKDAAKLLQDNIHTNYPLRKLADDISVYADSLKNASFEIIPGVGEVSEDGIFYYKPDQAYIVSLGAREILMNTELVWPCYGVVSSGFGARTHPITGEVKEHNGVDIIAEEGIPVGAVIRGTVTESAFDADKGNYVVVEYDGIKTLYSHLKSTNVTTGENISAGKLIGYVGSTGNSTGPHLHFELSVNGRYVNPEEFISKPDPQIKSDIINSTLASGESVMVNSGMLWHIDAKRTGEVFDIVSRNVNIKKPELWDIPYEVYIYSIDTPGGAEPRIYVFGRDKLLFNTSLDKTQYSDVIRLMENSRF